MARKTRIEIIGKRAAFNVEVWARAVEALARQLHRQCKETGSFPAVLEIPDETPKDGKAAT